MWFLLSTFSLIIVSILGQGTDGGIVVNPEDLITSEEFDSSEEIGLPDIIIPPEEIFPPEEIIVPDGEELPDLPEYPDSAEDPDNIQAGDDTGIAGTEDTENPTVILAQGTVMGSFASDGEYAQFYGIPYADATSGRNRFKAPNPPPTFQDTFIANRRDIKCVRALGVGYEGTEDCLVANVFTSTLENTRRLPVMVWVKGKEFDKTYAYEPSFKNFIDQGLVVVTLNYRESVLGFLCLGTETAPGNAGLKDITAGLKWVRDNIAQFGGNPNDITLVGHGSGAAAVDLVTLSPTATGLVHKAIAQSGTALSPWAVSRDNVNYAIQVAEALGHIITDIQELSAIFERTSVPALMGVINELDLTDNSLAFAPCLERESLEGVEPFMVRSPYEILMERQQMQIPFMTGYVDNEGTIRSEEAIEDDWLERMSESFTDFIQPDLTFETEEQKTQIAQQIRSFYFREDPIDLQQVDNYINYHGDTMILVSALREVRLRASTAPVYVYQFSYKGSLGEPFVGPLEVNSAAHSEELAYLFHDSTDNEIPARDRTIGDILVERWSWFAKTGLPMTSTSSVFWQPYSATQPNYLRVLDNDEINELSAFEVALVNPHPEAMTFWDEIYEEHFLDAEGRWDWTERDEDEEGSGEEGSGEEGSGEEGSGEEGSGEEGSGEEPTPEEDEDEGNSASTTIGYTFSIITLFAILNKIHESLILS